RARLSPESILRNAVRWPRNQTTRPRRKSASATTTATAPSEVPAPLYASYGLCLVARDAFDQQRQNRPAGIGRNRPHQKRESKLRCAPHADRGDALLHLVGSPEDSKDRHQ